SDQGSGFTSIRNRFRPRYRAPPAQFRVSDPGAEPPYPARNGPPETTPRATPLPHHGVMDSELIPPGHYGTRDVARALGTSPGALRSLAYRGRPKRAGVTERRPWYGVKDVSALPAKRQSPKGA